MLRERSFPKEHPIFSGVPAAVLGRLAAVASPRRLKPRELLLTEGTARMSFYVLVSGSVRVFYNSPRGAQVTVKIFKAPAVFGEMECLVGIPYLESVEALEPGQVLQIPLADFRRALADSHVFTTNLLVDLAARLCIAAQNERALAFNPVETRLANLLVTLVKLHGVPTADGVLIRTPLSQESLANSLGVARRSVTRTLARWVRQGALAKRGRHFVVRELGALQAAMDSELLSIGHSMEPTGG